MYALYCPDGAIREVQSLPRVWRSNHAVRIVEIERRKAHREWRNLVAVSYLRKGIRLIFVPSLREFLDKCTQEVNPLRNEPCLTARKR
jgi:hypothetical protein